MCTARLLIFVTAAAVLIFAAGCSSSSGQPMPATDTPGTSGSASSGGMTPHGAPRVANPLDVTKFEQNPCSMLTSAQLGRLGIAVQGQQDIAALYWGCNWNDSFGPTGTDVSPSLLKGGGGLDAVYSNRRSLQLFQPIADVDGYPALVAGTVDARSQGTCGVDVGLRDDVALNVEIQMIGGAHPAPNYSKPCDVAEEVAQAVVVTAKNGGS